MAMDAFPVWQPRMSLSSVGTPYLAQYDSIVHFILWLERSSVLSLKSPCSHLLISLVSTGRSVGSPASDGAGITGCSGGGLIPKLARALNHWEIQSPSTIPG